MVDLRRILTQKTSFEKIFQNS